MRRRSWWSVRHEIDRRTLLSAGAVVQVGVAAARVLRGQSVLALHGDGIGVWLDRPPYERGAMVIG